MAIIRYAGLEPKQYEYWLQSRGAPGVHPEFLEVYFVTVNSVSAYVYPQTCDALLNHEARLLAAARRLGMQIRKLDVKCDSRKPLASHCAWDLFDCKGLSAPLEDRQRWLAQQSFVEELAPERICAIGLSDPCAVTEAVANFLGLLSSRLLIAVAWKLDQLKQWPRWRCPKLQDILVGSAIP